MKEGQAVNLYREGKRHNATVLEIDGMGDSLAKTLKLVFKEDEQEYEIAGVKHLSDAGEGEPFWLLKGERAPRGWADEEPAEDAEIPEPVPVTEEAAPEPPVSKRKRNR